jgi:dTDP-4-amino-4,6-dideoxygalactose transaminase
VAKFRTLTAGAPPNNPKLTLPQSTDLIPFAVPDLGGNELKHFAECVEDNWISSAGPHVIALEETAAEPAGCAFGVAGNTPNK